MIKSVFVIGFYTLLSRVLGFVRDILVASMLGAGAQSDAFFVAFRLPNLLRRLFAEGAFNAAFVPMYARLIKDGGLPAARRFAGEAMSALLAILLAVTVLFELIMPWFMIIYAPGFTSDPGKFDLTVALSRITFVYLLFISLTTLFAGSLNSVGRFAAAAAAPILLNLVLVLSLLYLSAYTATPADALAWGVAIAGLLQFLWLGWCCHRAGILPTLHAPRLTP
ncbi:MAG: lipid II flippase MurJ, partial [Alphaproteobacteria bacterium]|nr:lipid II flippase MurJ [Alphaproteobacteria bacterium]